MSLLTLPAELRSLIFDFCFPPPKTQVQLIPYRALAPQCHLNLPLSLYFVCKLFYTELPLLSSKLRSLDFLYVIQGALIGPCSREREHGSRKDDDGNLRNFEKKMEHAERVRLVGEGKSRLRWRSLSSAPRRLSPGSKCALRILEVQPFLWHASLVARTLSSCLKPLIMHPDVVGRLTISLIRGCVGRVIYIDERGSEVTPSTSNEEEEVSGVDTETDDELSTREIGKIEDLLAIVQGEHTTRRLKYLD
ncbi:MAG: hypothetical protein M1836_005167 [Candelina mexicana]|nr:MAG: hypothetical protein M1836_005167 [Candelina mexicana]